MSAAGGLSVLLRIAAVLGALSLPDAQAAERKLADLEPFSAFVPADFRCQSDVTVKVRADEGAAFIDHRVELQKLVGGLRAILSFECPNSALTNLNIVGQAGGRQVYRGTAKASSNWGLADIEAPAAASTSAPSAAVSSTTIEEAPIYTNWWLIGAAAALGLGTAYFVLSRSVKMINLGAGLKGHLKKAPMRAPENQSSPVPSIGFQISPEVHTFLEGIVKDSGVKLPDPAHQKMIEELYEGLNRYILTEVARHMPEEYMDTFVKMNEQKKPKAELERFIKEHVPNAGAVVANAFTEFRKTVLEMTG